MTTPAVEVWPVCPVSRCWGWSATTIWGLIDTPAAAAWSAVCGKTHVC